MTNFCFSRKPAIGTWITTSDAKVLDAICSSGALDFVILDEEHGTCSSTSYLSLFVYVSFIMSYRFTDHHIHPLHVYPMPLIQVVSVFKYLISPLLTKYYPSLTPVCFPL